MPEENRANTVAHQESLTFVFWHHKYTATNRDLQIKMELCHNEVLTTQPRRPALNGHNQIKQGTNIRLYRPRGVCGQRGRRALL